MLLRTIFNIRIKALAVFLLVMLFSFHKVKAQNHYISDLKVIEEKDFKKNITIHHRRSFFFVSEKKFYKYNPVSLVFGGLMYVYQNVVSEQIAADCPYEISCSGFGRQVIKQYGLLKGTALAADRVMRCTRLSYKDLLPCDLNSSGKIIDNPEEYKSKNE